MCVCVCVCVCESVCVCVCVCVCVTYDTHYFVADIKNNTISNCILLL